MLTISIYRGDQRSKAHAASDGDLSQNSFSRLTLVLWSLIVIERFVERFEIGMFGLLFCKCAIVDLGKQSGGGLIVAPDTFTTVHHKLVIRLAARYRISAVYARRFFVDEGGLLSYGLDVLHQYRQAADYVDRILRGEKAAELPVQ